jgi:hypothetical protein
MIRKILIAISLALLAAISVGHAESSVDGLRLKSINGETVLKIDASGPFQYSHQVEEAKDGKPYRVIVDIFPAAHKLKQKIFADLPASIIKAVRTSQYSVKPEKIVRVVLDLKTTAVYRIEKSGDFIFVYIPDSENAGFPEWSSAGQPEDYFPSPGEYDGGEPPGAISSLIPSPMAVDEPRPKTSEPAEVLSESPGEKLPEVEEETVVSDFSESNPEMSSEPQVQIPLPPSAEPENQIEEPLEIPARPARYYRAVQSSFFEQEKAQWAKLQPPLAAIPVMESETQTVVGDEPAVGNPPAESPSPIIAQDESLSSAIIATAGGPISGATAVESATAMPPRLSDEITLSDSLAPSIIAAHETQSVSPPESAAVNTEDVYFDSSVIDAYVSPDDIPAIDLPADSAQERPTSRFRREPNFPAKLKGTIVAEFPQRMVIEYAPGVFRDPFETLIDETKQSDGPREDRIPDVETSRLVGILESENGNNRALLEDLDGYGYILKSGDKVKKGYVEKIEIDKVFFQLFEYGWSRTRALYLGHN